MRRQITAHKNAVMELMQPIDRVTAQKTRKTESGPRSSQSQWFEWNCSGCSPKFKLKMPRLHYGNAIDSMETTKLPPTPEMICQQPQETHIIEFHKTLTVKINSEHVRSNSVGEIVQNHIQCLQGKLRLKYPDPVGNLSRKTKLETRQYRSPMTTGNDNLKSIEMKLTWESMTVEMTAIALSKWQFDKPKRNFRGTNSLMNSTCHYLPHSS